MKFELISLIAVLVSLSYLIAGIQITGAYYAEPSGYGFHHIWTANLYLAASVTVLGIIAMVFAIRKVKRFLL